jgi:hypothetical protein
MKKIFVVGCPRSGTTLVQKLLGAHKDVYTCKETHYFQKIRRIGKRKVLDYLFLSQHRVLKAYDFIRSNNELLGQYNPSEVKSLRSAALFLDCIMTSEAQARGKLAWVEKTPHHLFYIRLIKRYIPSAQFVHVLRDGRDVVASLVDAAERFQRVWKEHTDLKRAIGLYNRSLRESLKYYGSEGHRFVRYGYILDDFAGACRKLYTLLDLESENLSLDLSGIHKRVVRSDESWKNDSEGRIKDTRLVKFNQIFDEEQKKLIVSRIKDLPSKEFDIM